MNKIFSTTLNKKYGPGFIAYSKKTGKIIAHSQKFGELYKQIRKTKPFKENKLVVGHIPSYRIRSAY